MNLLPKECVQNAAMVFFAVLAMGECVFIGNPINKVCQMAQDVIENFQGISKKRTKPKIAENVFSVCKKEEPWPSEAEVIRNIDLHDNHDTIDIVFPDLQIKKKVFEDLIDQNEKDRISLREKSFGKKGGKEEEYVIADNDADVCRKTGSFQTQISVDSTGGDSGVDHVESSVLSNETLDRYDQDLDFDEVEDWKELEPGYHFILEDCSRQPSMYQSLLDEIKPLLHDAELVANLFVRLANKHAKHCRKTTHMSSSHHLHSAQIVYHVINDGFLTNFSSVISYLLSYLGAIKTENPVPDYVSIPNILKFLNQLIGKDIFVQYHVNMLTCFLVRPNSKLHVFHEHRVSLLETCFIQETKSIDIKQDELKYLNLCFIKICEYFVPFGSMLTKKMVLEYLTPLINAHNSDLFIIDVLTSMGIIKEERTVERTSDTTSAITLLNHIFQSVEMRVSTSQILLNFIELENPIFLLCGDERNDLVLTLRKIVEFR